jgi:GNAT superfamily N-acetyltransferase
MNTTLTLRPATVDDAPAIGALIAELMPYMTLDPDGTGAEQFIATMQAPAIAGYLAQDRYWYRLALIDGELAGVIGVRDGSHVFHLFVARRFHGGGLARRLWQAARATAAPDSAWTVNSSPHAAAMYEHFGFRAIGPRVEQHGVAWIPMFYRSAPEYGVLL